MTARVNLASEATKADWQRDAGYPEIVRDDCTAGSLLQGRLMAEANADAGSRMAIIPIVAGMALLTVLGLVAGVVLYRWIYPWW